MFDLCHFVSQKKIVFMQFYSSNSVQLCNIITYRHTVQFIQLYLQKMLDLYDFTPHKKEKYSIFD